MCLLAQVENNCLCGLYLRLQVTDRSLEPSKVYFYYLMKTLAALCNARWRQYPDIRYHNAVQSNNTLVHYAFHKASFNIVVPQTRRFQKWLFSFQDPRPNFVRISHFVHKWYHMLSALFYFVQSSQDLKAERADWAHLSKTQRVSRAAKCAMFVCIVRFLSINCSPCYCWNIEALRLQNLVYVFSQTCFYASRILWLNNRFRDDHDQVNFFFMSQAEGVPRTDMSKRWDVLKNTRNIFRPSHSSDTLTNTNKYEKW